MQDITKEASTCISRLVGMCEVATARAEVAVKERDQFSQQVKMVEAENKRLREALEIMCRNALDLGYCDMGDCCNCKTTAALNGGVE